MPGIAIGNCIPFNRGGVNWSTYWATLISATVENAAPTHVVLTFPSEGTSVAADITCTVNSVARTVNSASWTGGVWTVVLASAVEYGDVVVMTFKLTNTTTATNNVLYAMMIQATGTSVDVSTLRMEVSADIVVTLGANAKFYSDAAGTLNESSTWSLTSGTLQTIYLRCPSGSALMSFSDASKLTKWGVLGSPGWIRTNNAPNITANISKLMLTSVVIADCAVIQGELPSSLTILSLYYVTWSSNLKLPNSLTYIRLEALVNWTGLDIGSGSNVTSLQLNNFLTSTKLSSIEMVTLLTQLTNRAGNLPATITINDYADYASPPAEVVAAVNALKLAKSITTVNLGA